MLSFILLIAFSWLIILLFFISSIVFFKNGFFTQKRIGKNGNIFTIYKIKSMSNDKKVNTIFGKFIRKFKLDELPQLLNILEGSMSFVGPRPILPNHFTDQTDYPTELLNLKPGLTGLASYYYFNEDDLFVKNHSSFLNSYFLRKNRLNLIYLRNKSFCFDLEIIYKTTLKVFRIR